MIRRLELEKNRALKYDLSSMVFLMVAAEPVRQKTLKKFIELTSPHGLSEYVMAPGYGLAENCVFVSCAYGEGKPILVDWQGRVSCGYVDYADRDVDVRIVDPQSGEERKYPEIEGEIWISRPSGGIGYWGRSELSETCSKPDPVKCTPEPAIWVWSSKGTCTSRVGSRISSLLVGGTFRRRNMRRRLVGDYVLQRFTALYLSFSILIELCSPQCYKSRT
ncbi:hypothetical protein ABFS82_03G024100 [Erythranthe guttata]|uniref:uncharacterized protein LOC105966877 isoform X2 n=1 Tax=Erythranthe guttata TaxID=4155 RepID=UPI00064D876A|nr:PREDICTED: uncharacterized protein LOC105966877 isoform X2 [Erythranthe guttata]|eukprot:XP_012846908.1 PREDICTED: uncharacterized protein LOC105966877 isoform X2 [Erythranthe guttata]